MESSEIKISKGTMCWGFDLQSLWKREEDEHNTTQFWRGLKNRALFKDPNKGVYEKVYMLIREATEQAGYSLEE